MKTDIDKLHKLFLTPDKYFVSEIIEERNRRIIIEKKIRGSGETTAILHLLAGEIELGDACDIFLIAKYLHEFRSYIWNMLNQILKEHEIKIIKTTFDYWQVEYEKDKYKTIHFVTPHMLERNCGSLGRHSTVFIYLD